MNFLSFILWISYFIVLFEGNLSLNENEEDSNYTPNKIKWIEFHPLVPHLNQQLCITPIFFLQRGHTVKKIILSYLEKGSWINIYEFKENSAKIYPVFLKERFFIQNSTKYTVCVKSLQNEDTQHQYSWQIDIVSGNNFIHDVYLFKIKGDMQEVENDEMSFYLIKFSPKSILLKEKLCLPLHYFSLKYFVKQFFIIAEKGGTNTTIYSITYYNKTTIEKTSVINRYPWEILLYIEKIDTVQNACFKEVSKHIMDYKYYLFALCENFEDSSDIKYKENKLYLPIVEDPKLNKIVKIDLNPLVPSIDHELCMSPVYSLLDKFTTLEIVFAYLEKSSWHNIYTFTNKSGGIIVPSLFEQNIHLKDSTKPSLCFKTLQDENLQHHYSWQILIVSFDLLIRDIYSFKITLDSYQLAEYEVSFYGMQFVPPYFSPTQELCASLGMSTSSRYYIKEVSIIVDEAGTNTTLYYAHNETPIRTKYINKEGIWKNRLRIPESQDFATNICFKDLTFELVTYKYYWIVVVENFQDSSDKKYRIRAFNLPTANSTTLNKISQVEFNPATPILSQSLCFRPIYTITDSFSVYNLSLSYFTDSSWNNIYIYNNQEPWWINDKIIDVSERFKNTLYVKKDKESFTLCFNHLSEEAVDVQYRWKIYFHSDKGNLETNDEYKFKINADSPNLSTKCPCGCLIKHPPKLNSTVFYIEGKKTCSIPLHTFLEEQITCPCGCIVKFSSLVEMINFPTIHCSPTIESAINGIRTFCPKGCTTTSFGTTLEIFPAHNDG